MNPKQLNLYIVDDDKPFQRSLAMLCLSHLEGFSVQPFDYGEDFLENAKLDASGVAILDLRFVDDTEPRHRMNGLEIFQKLKERNSPLVVVFLSGHGSVPDAVRAMQDGAVSWLQKTCSHDELLGTINKAQDVARAIANRRREQHAAQAQWSRLTQREMEVAPLVAKGQSAKAIAQTLTEFDPQRPVHYRTVETYRASVFAKLGLANANELQTFLSTHFPEDLKETP